MKKLLTLLGLIGLIAAIAEGGDFFFSFNDVTSRPQGVRMVLVYPEILNAVSPVGLTTRDRIAIATGTNGSIVVSNLVAGRYRVEFQGTYLTTTNWFGFPQTNGFCYATNFILNPLLYAGVPVYSTTSADQRFWGKGELVAGTNVSYRTNLAGLVFIDGGAGGGGVSEIAATNAAAGYIAQGGAVTNGQTGIFRDTSGTAFYIDQHARPTTDVVGLKIQPFDGQTSDLQQWTDHETTPFARMTADGIFKADNIEVLFTLAVPALTLGGETRTSWAATNLIAKTSATATNMLAFGVIGTLVYDPSQNIFTNANYRIMPDDGTTNGFGPGYDIIAANGDYIADNANGLALGSPIGPYYQTWDAPYDLADWGVATISVPVFSGASTALTSTNIISLPNLDLGTIPFSSLAGLAPATTGGPITEGENLAWAARHIAEATTSLHGRITETWSDLSAWDVTEMQVSGGRCYGTSMGRGATRSILLRPDETLRVTAKYYFPDVAFSDSFYFMVGLNCENPGVLPSGDGTYPYAIKHFIGIGFYNNGGSSGRVIPQFVDTENGNNRQTVDWRGPWQSFMREGIICIYADTNSISFTLFSEGQTNAWTMVKTRASFPNINKIAIINSSNDGLNGPSIGLLGAVKGTYAMDPRVESLGFFKLATTNANGDGYSVMLPTNYSSQIAHPVVLCLHGSGAQEEAWPYLQNPDPSPYYGSFGGTTNYNWSSEEELPTVRAISRMLLGSGFILASGKMGQLKPVNAAVRTDPMSASEVDMFNGSTWGNDSVPEGVRNLIHFTRERFPVSHMVYYALSMGGATAFRAIHDNVAAVDGFVGIAPALNLGAYRIMTPGVWPNTSVSNAWTNALPPSWAVITNHHRSFYTGTRIQLYHSEGDSTVNASDNSLWFKTWMQGWTTNTQVFSTAEGVTGNHGQKSNYKPQQIVDFFNSCISHQ